MNFTLKIFFIFLLHSIYYSSSVSSIMLPSFHLLLLHKSYTFPNIIYHLVGPMLAIVYFSSCMFLVFFSFSIDLIMNIERYSRSAILSPLLGYIVDKTGRNLYWLMGSITATIVAHALIAFLFVHPIVPNVLMGISYSILAASLWPMVAFLVPKKMLGTAYGMMQSIQNLGLAVMYVLLFFFFVIFSFGFF